MSAHAPKADTAGERELVLTRVFNAPRALVFSCWAESAHVSKWFAAAGFAIVLAEVDFRVGGAWRSHMRSPKETDHRMQGVFREILKDRRIVMTHAWLDAAGKPGHETLLTVDFADCELTKTKIMFHQALFETVSSRDAHRGGWSGFLDNLAAFLDKTAK